MVKSEYMLCMNYDEQGILNKIHDFIYNLHQGNQTPDEYKVTVTVEKYSEKDWYDEIFQKMGSLLTQYKCRVITLNEFRKEKKALRKKFSEDRKSFR